jgi:uncharacterized membrane protein
MKIVLKTAGWLFVSGVIIFTSNIASGVEWRTALYGAAIAKIGTTIAYFFYELFCQRLTTKGESKHEVLNGSRYDATTMPEYGVRQAPCV